MCFDIQINDQCSQYEDKLKASFYKSLHFASKKTNWMRATGLGIGIVSGFLGVCTSIGLIFENIIKGLINIFGSIGCNKKFNATLGCKQLFIRVPLQILGLIGSCLSAATGLLTKTGNMMYDPIAYTKKRWFSHDPIYAEMIAQQEKKERYRFVQAQTQQDVIDINAFKKLAAYYEDGVGTAKNPEKAYQCYVKAAELGDAEAMHNLAGFYAEGKFVSKNPTIAFNWNHKAALAGNTDAMIQTGASFETGSGTTQDLKAAVHWYNQASLDGNSAGTYQLGKMHAFGQGVPKNMQLGLKLMRQAAHNGIKTAFTMLAAILYVHPDLSANKTESIQWTNKANDTKGIADLVTYIKSQAA